MSYLLFGVIECDLCTLGLICYLRVVMIVWDVGEGKLECDSDFVSRKF